MFVTFHEIMSQRLTGCRPNNNEAHKDVFLLVQILSGQPHHFVRTQIQSIVEHNINNKRTSPGQFWPFLGPSGSKLDFSMTPKFLLTQKPRAQIRSVRLAISCPGFKTKDKPDLDIPQGALQIWIDDPSAGGGAHNGPLPVLSVELVQEHGGFVHVQPLLVFVVFPVLHAYWTDLPTNHASEFQRQDLDCGWFALVPNR